MSQPDNQPGAASRPLTGPRGTDGHGSSGDAVAREPSTKDSLADDGAWYSPEAMEAIREDGDRREAEAAATPRRQPPQEVAMYEVRYNDNSDYGLAVEKFDTEADALTRADVLEANPPKGNHFHPAPENLDLSVLRVERVR